MLDRSAASSCSSSIACALTVRYTDVMDYPPSLAFKIGLFQCLALVPGVSRSGATIVGAMLFGTDKRSAAEFSFFLAMPTMAGAFAYDLYKNWSILKPEDITNIALGFVVAFISAVFVVRHLLDLCEPARVCAVWLVAHHCRRRCDRRAARARTIERLPGLNQSLKHQTFRRRATAPSG